MATIDEEREPMVQRHRSKAIRTNSIPMNSCKTPHILSVELLGIEGYLVDIETDTQPGLPVFVVVGLPDAAVQEARERVKSAIKNSNLLFPRQRVIVNLAPADVKKSGPRHDLAMALGILSAMGEVPCEAFQGKVVLGELALDGAVRGVNGILASLESALKRGIREAIIPAENAQEAALLPGMKLRPVASLKEALAHARGICSPLQIRSSAPMAEPLPAVDLAEIAGQGQAKRALEIAALGRHNLLFMGPPGSGKTMLGRALPGILPAPTFEEKLEITKIHSVAGLISKETPLAAVRPFRAVHHTASAASIAGGGHAPMPGEISLAHRGILFLDEIAEFSVSALEVLRQPLEEKRITISRARGSWTFPADFMLVAAMNPCPCGWYGSGPHGKRCICKEGRVTDYQNRLSGPMLDRFDMALAVQPVKRSELETVKTGESSAAVRARIERARDFCRGRKKEDPPESLLHPEARALLGQAMDNQALSARGYSRTLQVARTIADLEGSPEIRRIHAAEALQYRKTVLKN